MQGPENPAGLQTTARSCAEYRVSLPGSPFGIAWGFVYGYGGIRAETFLPQLRRLGAGFTKVYLFWNQLEPERGHYDWTAVDAFLNQLDSPEEGLISLFASSQWATRRPAAMLPPSPAKDLADYYRCVFNLVKHCAGRVRYWQNNAEPNNPVFWAGTKEEFVEHLKVFHKAVKEADPTAVVIVGGFDGLFNPPGWPPFPHQQAGLEFFDYVLREGRDAFDLFDLRLYGNPYTIVGRVGCMRQKMLALGYEKPIVCTEYGGPSLFEFPENRTYRPLVEQWAQSVSQSAENAGQAVSPISELYRNMSSLAAQTQMFMQECPSELDAKFRRIQARGLVMRNVLALSAGVQKTVYWELLDISDADRNNLMIFMFGKIGMLGYQEGALEKRYPTADAFELMAHKLAGVQRVRQIETAENPALFLFKVDRGDRGSIQVVWERRDQFSGEDSPAVPFTCLWNATNARCVDALGEVVPHAIVSGRLHIMVSLTPIFIESAG